MVVVGVFVRVTISWLFMRRKTTKLVFNVHLFFKGHFMLSYSSLFFEVSLLKKVWLPYHTEARGSVLEPNKHKCASFMLVFEAGATPRSVLSVPMHRVIFGFTKNL